MRNLIPFLIAVAIAMSLSLSTRAQEYDENYAQDRAQIEDLQARYLFAMNWGDLDTYASTFTEDAELEWARGTVNGRDAIRREVELIWRLFSGRDGEGEPSALAPNRRHFIGNKVIKVDGDTAVGRAYWYEFDVGMTGNQPFVLAYGHYEDEMRKVDGQWLFSKRAIYNQILEGREASAENPAW